MPPSGAGQTSRTSKTLVLVSHTHWDREWYLTFQQYRFKLVRLIDRLLNILDNEPGYAFFMLDGQTIILEDYLEIRPERRADLKRQIEAGRLLIGPWYILADQFLVSGEAHIQNLLRGRQTAAEFGPVMPVGYIPDPFGHIGQMPQILRGFGIDSAVFWRGVGPEIGQVEFVWLAPDGTSVDGVHLPGSANIGGYSTALAWNSGSKAALAQLPDLQKILIERAKSGAVLLMNGNDHVEPKADFPTILHEVQSAVRESGQPYEFVHGTLPMYLELARQSGVWQDPGTPRHVGEFRDSSLAHLLPGVLSSRMPIKQRNAQVERLLEREAGAALAWASSLAGSPTQSFDPASLRALYATAWKYLLQNQPHDSICGCSIDQVHDEMETRYDWAEQIAHELIREGWGTLAGAIDTSAQGATALPLVISNPVPFRRTELAGLSISAPDGLTDVVVTDAAGTILPHRLAQTELEMLFNMDIPASALEGSLAQAGDEGRIMDYTMSKIEFEHSAQPNVMDVKILAIHGSAIPTDPALMARTRTELQTYITEGKIKSFRLSVYRQTGARLEFLAKDVPAQGYKTFFMRPRKVEEPLWPTETVEEPEAIENEFYTLNVDPKTGLFTAVDKESGVTFAGLNGFRDGADAGDTYNYAPAVHDTVVEKLFAAPSIQVRRSSLESSIEMQAALELPYSLSEDRQSRGSYKTICPLTVKVRLVPGQRRIDFETTFFNEVEDHRLQVVFPAPFAVTSSQSEGAFDVVERSTELPPYDKNWREDPVPTAPHKTFVSIFDPAQKLGLSVMNQGLPEYEIIPADETSGSKIALTLLRCVGWLSRSDLSTRRDHAGPGLATPGAQLRGRHTFRYAVMPHRGSWLQAAVQQQAHAFNHPLSGVTAAVQSGPVATLPVEGSFLEIQPRAIALSTVKPSEDGRAVVVRLWNPATRDIPQARVKLYRLPARASLVNLAEDTTLEELTPDAEGNLTFALPAKRIATLRLEF